MVWTHAAQCCWKVDFKSGRWTTNFQRWNNIIDLNVRKTHFQRCFNIKKMLDFSVETSDFNVETTSDSNIETTSDSNVETTSDFNIETSDFNVEL